MSKKGYCEFPDGFEVGDSQEDVNLDKLNFNLIQVFGQDQRLGDNVKIFTSSWIRIKDGVCWVRRASAKSLWMKFYEFLSNPTTSRYKSAHIIRLVRGKSNAPSDIDISLDRVKINGLILVATKILTGCSFPAIAISAVTTGMQEILSTYGPLPDNIGLAANLAFFVMCTSLTFIMPACIAGCLSAVSNAHGISLVASVASRFMNPGTLEKKYKEFREYKASNPRLEQAIT